MLAFLVSRRAARAVGRAGLGDVWAYLLTQAEVIVHYLRLAFVPAPLVFFYDWPLGTSLGAVAWQAALLAALVVLTAVGIARRHPASFLGAWFFLILAPSSSVLPIVTEVAAEHRMYLPLAAVIAAVVIGAFLLGRRLDGFAESRRWPSRPSRSSRCVGVLGAETRARNRVYWSAESLWGDTVAKRPDDARPRVAYGEALADAGRLAEAEVQLRTAIELAPDDPVARVRLGAMLAQQRRHRRGHPASRARRRAAAGRSRCPPVPRRDQRRARPGLAAVRHLSGRSRRCRATRG